MKIAIFTRGLLRGGTERQICVLANGLAERGHEVTVVVFYGGLPLEEDLHHTLFRLRLYVLGKHGRWDVAQFLTKLIIFLRSENFDALYSFLPLPNVLAALISPFLRKTRLIWGLRSSSMSWVKYDWLVRAIAVAERCLSSVPDLLIANSEAGREDFIRAGYPASRLVIIANGINTNKFRFNADGRRTLRCKWRVGPEHILIGAVGRVDPMKGVEVFIKTAAALATRTLNCRFVWIGDGNVRYIDSLNQHVESLGIGSIFSFKQGQDDVSAVYSAFDVFCLTSTFGEGFPNALAEAMSCERIAVATNVGDAAKIIGRYGLIVPVNNANALAQALEGIIHTGKFDHADARQHIINCFDINRPVVETEKALNSLVTLT